MWHVTVYKAWSHLPLGSFRDKDTEDRKVSKFVAEVELERARFPDGKSTFPLCHMAFWSKIALTSFTFFFENWVIIYTLVLAVQHNELIFVFIAQW